MGTVRLCQRPAASCAACCGIYNRTDFDRDSVRAELRRHTWALARAERTPEAFREVARRLEADAPPGLFPSIRVCQLVGFLDERETRVGCLAHPKATGGVDLRGCGVYDVETCESFLCPSHAFLTEQDAAIVEAVTDPHLFGLVATDGHFVRAVLGGLAETTGQPVDLRLARIDAVGAALRRLFAAKEALEPGSDGLFGAFRHGGGDRPQGTAEEEILTALGGDERSGNDPEQLEHEVRRRFVACVAAVRAARTRK